MGNKLIEVHSLTALMPSLLNRGENGEAKTITIGGTKRARISSQCLKYAMTQVDGKRSFIATKHISEMLLKMNNEDLELSEDEKNIVKTAIEKTAKILFIDAITRFTDAEINSIYCAFKDYKEYEGISDAKKIAKIIKDKVDSVRNNLEMQLNMAIYGRFTAVKDNIGYTNESAIHMAHAFSIDAYSDDRDFFTAVDSFIADTEDMSGAGMLQSSDIEGNTMYKYMNLSPIIAWENVNKGLTVNKEALADEMVNAVVDFIIKSPVAKQHSNASYERPSIVYITVGEVAPITMGSRFQKVIKPRNNKTVMEQGIEKFIDHIKDDAYAMDECGYDKKYAIILSEYSDYKEKLEGEGVEILNLKSLRSMLKEDILKEFSRFS